MKIENYIVFNIWMKHIDTRKRKIMYEYRKDIYEYKNRILYNFYILNSIMQFIYSMEKAKKLVVQK